MYQKVSTDMNFVEREKQTRKFWEDNGVFEKSIELRENGENYITDGPFMYRSKTDELFMLWSTFINNQYAECLVKFNDGELNMNFTHLDPLIDDDGGHGMIFKDDENLYLTFHSPNKSLSERPKIIKIIDNGSDLKIK